MGMELFLVSDQLSRQIRRMIGPWQPSHFLNIPIQQSWWSILNSEDIFLSSH